MTFDRLLVANRGEIACRVMRTAKALGLGTVAVHSAIGCWRPSRAPGDQAVDLGGTKPADSYLLGERIIAAALTTGAQAIHPGYGFLSETPPSPRRWPRPGWSSSGHPRQRSAPWAASPRPRR